jgi:hypothetical protein
MWREFAYLSSLPHTQTQRSRHMHEPGRARPQIPTAVKSPGPSPFDLSHWLVWLLPGHCARDVCPRPRAWLVLASLDRPPYKRARISLRALHLPPACPPTTVVRTSRACMHDDGSICMRTRLVTKVNSLLLSPRTSLTVTGNNAR